MWGGKGGKSLRIGHTLHHWYLLKGYSQEVRSPVLLLRGADLCERAGAAVPGDDVPRG